MDKTMTNPYSKQSLKSLAQILKVHRSLIWINPVTNSIDVKRLFPRVEEPQVPQQVSYA